MSTDMMSAVTDSLLINSLMALTTIACILYWWYTRHHNYWKNKGVPDTESDCIVNTLLGMQPQVENVINTYQKLAKERFVGIFRLREPMLMIRDPKLIHQVMVKDFSYFQDRGPPNTDSDPLTSNLFFLRGYTWRTLRYKLTPTFTSGKLKGMFEQVAMCGDSLLKKVEQLSKDDSDVNTKTFMFEYTIDVISSCALGIQFEPNSPEYNKFTLAAKKIYKGGYLMSLRFAVVFLFPKLIHYLYVTLFPKFTKNYFLSLIKANIRYREDNNIYRNDYFQLLLTLKKQEESGIDFGPIPDASENDTIINQMQHTEQNSQVSHANIKFFSDDSICANSFIFLLAGSETTATTITHILYELSQNPDIHQRVQEEVDSVLARHGGWSYDAVKDMTYMDMVMQETLRKYPTLPLLTRECVTPYKIPGSDLVLDKGMVICIPVMGLHMDPQYYPDPQRFDPTRFKDNNFRPNSTYMPFGDGPRICIGMRFAIMQVKTCVGRVLSEYSVKLSPKTQLPIKFDKQALVPEVKGGIWLKFEKRKM